MNYSLEYLTELAERIRREQGILKDYEATILVTHTGATLIVKGKDWHGQEQEEWYGLS